MGEDERRKFKRKKKQCVISFHVIEGKGLEKKQEGVVVDCSQGGVRFTSKSSIDKNSRIYNRLDSEDWGEELTYFCKDTDIGLVEVIGSVMWCLESENRPGEYEVGTRFIEQIEH
jgi:hypothetical protein